MNELNEKLIDLLKKWDPLGYGSDAYDTEVVDVIQALYEIEDPKYLAKRIQFIYEFSFEELIPIKDCQSIANEMLTMKEVSSCSIN